MKEKKQQFFLEETLIDPSHTLAGDMLSRCYYPWDMLPKIGECIKEIINGLDKELYDDLGNNVWVAKSANIAKSALICGPAVIGENAEIRHCAYIRGNVLIGNGAVVGNSCELKNAIVSDEVQIPHYNYVGDSILGYRSHMGAGAIASNFRLDKKQIKIGRGEDSITTGLRKMGVILGDHSEVGCNSVLYPGTVIGKNCLVYPLTGVRGIVPSDTIVKSDGSMTKRKIN